MLYVLKKVMLLFGKSMLHRREMVPPAKGSKMLVLPIKGDQSNIETKTCSFSLERQPVFIQRNDDGSIETQRAWFCFGKQLVFIQWGVITVASKLKSVGF